MILTEAVGDHNGMRRITRGFVKRETRTHLFVVIVDSEKALMKVSKLTYSQDANDGTGERISV